jgi:hypothetical protein
MIRSTYTYVTMDVSPSTYAEIRKKLVDAGYDHAISKDGGEETLDMHGIALTEGIPDGTILEVGEDSVTVKGVPDYLRDDAPCIVCLDCGRKSWSNLRGDVCDMIQPNRSRCKGVFA